MSTPKQVANFVQALTSTTTTPETAARIKREVEIVRSMNNTLSSLKSAFSMYRKSFLKAEPNYKHDPVYLRYRTADTVIFDSANEAIGVTPETYMQRVLDRVEPTHNTNLLVLAMFRLVYSERDSLRRDKTERLNQDMTNKRQIYDAERVQQRAIELMGSQYYSYRLVGLALATGRRPAELGTSAKFTVKDESTIIFEGQLKTKGRREVGAYEIPTLVNAYHCAKVLNELHTEKPDLVGDDKTIMFHNRCSKQLSKVSSKWFQDLFEPLVKNTYGGTVEAWQVKDARAVYATLTHHIFSNNTQSIATWFRDVLGHGADDTMTAQSYEDFYV